MMQQGSGYGGDMHHQLYRPTEAEAKHGHGHAAKPKPVRKESTPRDRIEEKVQAYEGRLGGFMKRLDKLI